jgi:hypothetical protein
VIPVPPKPTPSLFGGKASDDVEHVKTLMESIAAMSHVRHMPTGEVYRVHKTWKGAFHLIRVDPETSEDLAVKPDLNRLPQVGSLLFLRGCVETLIPV